MNFFDRIQNLLGWSDTLSNQPYLHETMDRSDDELDQYQHWFNQPESYALLKEYKNAFYHSENPTIAEIVRSPSINGLVFYYDPNVCSIQDFRHFFDYLKKQLLKLNYVCHLSDVRIFNRPEKIEEIERYQLKPPFSIDERGKIDQSFGNVIIEHIHEDKRPVCIKFSSRNYNDRSYQVAQSFDQLIMHIFEPLNESNP